MIGAPIVAFLASLHGVTLVSILTAILILGLILNMLDGGRHALYWVVGFMVVSGIIVAISSGAAWFAGV